MGASDARSDIRASAWEIALMRNDIGDGGRFLQSTQPEYRDSGLHQRHLCHIDAARSEEHTSELQSLMRISYAVFCLKKKITQITLLSLHYYHATDYQQNK